MRNIQTKQTKKCTFCSIRDRNYHQVPFFEDDEIFVFEDINLASSQRHIQICPKRHIQDTKHLLPSDCNLLQNMEKIGRMILERSHPGKEYRFGYHSPPFISVDHLHFHGFVLPLTNCWKDYIKYGIFLISNQTFIDKLNSQNKNYERKQIHKRE